MINFIISIVVFAVSVFLLGVSIRYGLTGVTPLDSYFSKKNNSSYQGFQWHFRIPFSIGVIPEYFYAMVITGENYFKTNWWALKTASFISVLLFIAGLKSRSAVLAYFSFDFISENGLLALFTSGNFVHFMNIIVLLYATLFILICIESVRMHGIYAPIRIVAYSILSIFMANLTIITLSIIIFITLAYLAYKIIRFFFFSSQRRRREEEEEEEETTTSILRKGFIEFKAELDEWEHPEKPDLNTKPADRSHKRTTRKRPKITRRRVKKTKTDGDIPRLHPD